MRGILKELIIENFMSYKYARINFKPGLNLIIGPNGSGKSSILLALSIALGQSYTERSRKLGELIRWGEEYGRITVKLDNSEINGERPFPRIKRDEVVITRYLRRDGHYHFELNYRDVAKAELSSLLKNIGLNPDNQLIIMHQNMIEAFGVVDPQTKIRMFEEAVGLKDYRDKILESRNKLSTLLNEEEELVRNLSEAEGLLARLKKEYKKLLKKRSLISKRDFLLKEFLWSKYFKSKSELDQIKKEISRVSEEIAELKTNAERYRMLSNRTYQVINTTYYRLLEIMEELLHISYEMGSGNASLENELSKLKERFNETIEKLRDSYSEHIDAKINEGITNYRLSDLENRLRELKKHANRLSKEVDTAYREAIEESEQIRTSRKPSEILNEIREIDLILRYYKDVDDEIEETYKYYRRLSMDLKRKVEDVRKNREEAAKELDKRIRIWKEKLANIVSDVSLEYSRLLNGLGARGYARIINSDDVDNAGLELVVGFRGGEEKVLDAYTQSGGERTTAVMLFLIALQTYIKSPLRAVDEFDVHMDPRNRELIMTYLLEIMRDRQEQYIVITPGYVTDRFKDSHIIIVQKTGEYSVVNVLREVDDVRSK